MADINILANDAPAEQAHAIAPPTRTDDQISPSSNSVPIGKSNYVLDLQKSQRNPIFPIAGAILKNTNFFRAFTSSSTILAIYIQQDALDNTPTNDNDPFVDLPSSDIVIKYVNTMGYPSTLRNVKLLDSTDQDIMCCRFCGGIVYSSNIDYAERIWEESIQSIQTFLTGRKNLATASRGKKKTTHLLIPSIRFTKLIIHHLKTKHNIQPRSDFPLHYSHDESVMNTLRYVGKDGRKIFGMPIPDALLTDEIKRAPYYNEYQEHVAKYQQHMDAEHGKAIERGAIVSSKATKVTKPKAAKAAKPASKPEPKPTPTQPTKAAPEKKQKLIQKSPDEPSPTKRWKGGLVRKICKPMSSLMLVDGPSAEDVQGPARLVVIMEPDFARFQPLSETLKNKSPVDQFIFQRRTPMPAEASGPDESPSLDTELVLIDSETEFDDEVPEINTGDQDIGHDGPNPSI
uniref:Uncharacterized protein n=1 Tax=Tanacetum cinerariifolium TaxID=118510 RepID=A0A6L2KB68_TANCI|nr:hypothetical protein [Tanacetum cinerariifolium]